MPTVPRVRICFSKTGLACFISHTDLPMLFGRAARRAGLKPELTQGFSPHPRLVLAPPLPVGVVGLREPADFWFAAWGEESFPRWRAAMPYGFGRVELLSAAVIDDMQMPSLAKLCSAATYRVASTVGGDHREIARALERSLRESGGLLDVFVPEEGDAVELSVRDLERNAPSGMVRILREAGIVREWSELLITRTAVGGWNETERSVTPLV